VALRPALATIDATIHAEVIRPVVQQVRQQLHTVLTRPYGPEFVQTHVATALERVTESIFKKFPPAYSSSMANEIAEHTVLTFVTTVSLIRPMSENLRLQITQDLADLELAVQQLVASSSSSGITTTTEAWIHSKGYAELRAVRQMLYWTGLEQSSARTAPEIAKSILREVWLSDVRPSTIFHYLFTFAPSALAAPYHVANLSASAYVEQIVANEETTWIMVCCDRYGQRGAAASDGDSRVAQIVLTLGQELLRRRGRNE
jgi:conserved oligomeric Golgi complex subunit 5